MIFGGNKNTFNHFNSRFCSTCFLIFHLIDDIEIPRTALILFHSTQQKKKRKRFPTQQLTFIL